MSYVMTIPAPAYPYMGGPRRRGLGDSSSDSKASPITNSLIQAGISLATTLLIGPISHLISGCGQSCVMASNWANDAENLLKQNIQTYFKQPVRTVSMQAAFLQNFDAIFNHMEQQCSQVGGAAGANCIGDRQAGACKWKASANSPWPGGPAQGACFNWFNAYRDPIANDAAVVPDPVASGGSVDLSALSSGGSLLPLALIAGLVVAGVML